MATPVTESSATASPAAVAASFVLGLCLLCICFCLLPDGSTGTTEGPWAHLCTWLQMVDLTAIGYLGIWLTPGSGLPFNMLVALTALTCAYAAALCGAHALLGALRGRPSQGIRAGLAVVTALAITAMLWTKAPLQLLQRKGEWGMAAYDSGTQTVASLSPVVGWSVYWSASETGFNLTKATHAYQLWLGPGFISPPQLWPGRSGFSSEDQGPWALGLVIGLLAWGLGACIAGDLARMRSKAAGTEPIHLTPDHTSSSA
jgi:hypothetical protein